MLRGGHRSRLRLEHVGRGDTGLFIEDDIFESSEVGLILGDGGGDCQEAIFRRNGWTWTIRVEEGNGDPVVGAAVVVRDKDEVEVGSRETGLDGTVAIEVVRLRQVTTLGVGTMTTDDRGRTLLQ